ncbi:MAG: hypothetical protein K1W13_12490 [Lachnospiraceae bacterium]
MAGSFFVSYKIRQEDSIVYNESLREYNCPMGQIEAAVISQAAECEEEWKYGYR